MINENIPSKILENEPRKNLYVVMGARMESKTAKAVFEVIKKMDDIWSAYDDEETEKETKLEALKNEYQYDNQPKDIQEKWDLLLNRIKKGEEVLLDNFEWPIIIGNATNSGMSDFKGEFVTGEARIEAAGIINKLDPKAHFVTTGGLEEIITDDGKKHPFFEKAVEMAEAVKRQGVDSDNVTPLTHQFPKTTEGDAVLVWDYLNSPEGQKLHPKGSEINLVTSDYHILRCWLLFSKNFYENSTNKKWNDAITNENKLGAVSFLVSKFEKILNLKNKLDYSSEEMIFDFEAVQRIFADTFKGANYTAVPKIVEQVFGSEKEAKTDKPEKRIVLKNEYIAVIKLILGDDLIKKMFGRLRLNDEDITQIPTKLKSIL